MKNNNIAESDDIPGLVYLITNLTKKTCGMNLFDGGKKSFPLSSIALYTCRGRRSRDRMVVALKIPMQSVPIITNVVLKFFSALRLIGALLRVFMITTPLKLLATIQLKYCRIWLQTP
jgi:hypothetical protein